jgi:hypothetical protein
MAHGAAARLLSRIASPASKLHLIDFIRQASDLGVHSHDFVHYLDDIRVIVAGDRGDCREARGGGSQG